MTAPELCAEIREGCTKASLGCVDCKKLLMESLTRFLEPVHERRNALLKDPERLWAILAEGNAKARAVAARNMTDIRKALNLDF